MAGNWSRVLPFEFGSKVKVTAVYRRAGTTRERKNRKYWRVNPIAPREGLYIGYRTLYNGYVEYDDYGGTFHPQEHYKAALVVFNEREKPVLVPLAHIERA